MTTYIPIQKTTISSLSLSRDVKHKSITRKTNPID